MGAQARARSKIRGAATFLETLLLPCELLGLPRECGLRQRDAARGGGGVIETINAILIPTPLVSIRAATIPSAVIASARSVQL
jgi:hypothetical protein